MCIAAFVWQAHPLYPLILLQNRDEYHDRQVIFTLLPTDPVAWWAGCDILGGRDAVAGGTWLGCSRTGRVAFLTNVLELHSLPEAKSRGELPVLFLQSRKNPKEFAEELAKEAHDYNGFNLILADIPSKSMVYFSNRPEGETIVVREVSPGLHVLSNAKLNSPWLKVERLRLNFKEQLENYGKGEIPVKEMLQKLMRDTVKADMSKLPGICSPEWEFNLSSIFVEVLTPLGCYGTRSSVALTIKTNGEVSFYETYLEKGIWKERTVNYCIQKLKQIEIESQLN
ncbi:hypothetical protein Tsubulata_049613 [Turnera subulata]|uniref:Transport and Golgi organization protein 2 homolog n=1 Tax=Turnera subulata TaxID=218843 RepID=A0A9Q0J792_9ROSI|nr:hypothetical protein Tsubulata_049613 [Turnera subulata]